MAAQPFLVGEQEATEEHLRQLSLQSELSVVQRQMTELLPSEEELASLDDLDPLPRTLGRADAMDLPADDPRINTQVGVDVKVIITPRCILVFH
jgi:hypothetical protein